MNFGWQGTGVLRRMSLLSHLSLIPWLQIFHPPTTAINFELQYTNIHHNKPASSLLLLISSFQHFILTSSHKQLQANTVLHLQQVCMQAWRPPSRITSLT